MAPAAERARILVVDDAPDALELIQRNLTANRYQVFTAPGAVEAIRILEDTSVDLVITDLTMPEMTGKELAQEILHIRPNVPIILFTGLSDQMTEKEVETSGISELVMKPVNMDYIARKVRKAIDKKTAT